MSLILEYRSQTLFPASRLRLALDHGERSFPAKSFVMTAELYGEDGSAISPKNLSWYFSTYLGATFYYVPESGRGMVPFPDALKSVTPFCGFRVCVAPWGDKARAGDVSSTFGNLIYSYVLSPDPNDKSLAHAEITGVVAPMTVEA